VVRILSAGVQIVGRPGREGIGLQPPQFRDRHNGYLGNHLTLVHCLKLDPDQLFNWLVVEAIAIRDGSLNQLVADRPPCLCDLPDDPGRQPDLAPVPSGFQHVVASYVVAQQAVPYVGVEVNDRLFGDDPHSSHPDACVPSPPGSMHTLKRTDAHPDLGQ
jgi:hypothetical protein